MKRVLDVILLVFASVVFGSCSKNVFSNGDLKERKDTIVEPFRSIEFCDDVNVTIRHCDEDHIAGLIHLRTGENLMDSITTTIQKEGQGNRLVIHNNNTLNYLRPYNYTLEMTVWYDTLHTLVFNSNGTVHTDTLRGILVCDTIANDSTVHKQKMQINIIGGSGDLVFLMGGGLLYTDYKAGTGNVYAKGASSYAHTQTKYECHGIIDYRNMEIHNHDIFHQGTNRIYTKVFSNLRVRNLNNGEVHYLKYRKQTFDFIPPSEGDPWGHHELVWHFCPEALNYNDKMINSWTYKNNLPGLVKDTIN